MTIVSGTGLLGQALIAARMKLQREGPHVNWFTDDVVIDANGPGDPRLFTRLNYIAYFNRWREKIDELLQNAKIKQFLHVTSTDASSIPFDWYSNYKAMQMNYLSAIYMPLPKEQQLRLIFTAGLFGPGMNEHRYIPNTIRKAIYNLPIDVWCSEGRPSVRAWTDVEKFAEMLMSFSKHITMCDIHDPALRHFTFVATSDVIAQRIVRLTNSKSEIRMVNFYDTDESRSHLFDNTSQEVDMEWIGPDAFAMNDPEEASPLDPFILRYADKVRSGQLDKV